MKGDKLERSQAVNFLSNAYVSKKLYEKYCLEADKKYNLTICEGEVLMQLHMRGGESTARDIVEQIWSSKSQVSKAVEKLTSIGYVNAVTDENDRRVVRLSLTEAATAPLKDLNEATEQYLERLFEGLEYGELVELNRLLEKMAQNVKRKSGEDKR